MLGLCKLVNRIAPNFPGAKVSRIFKFRGNNYFHGCSKCHACEDFGVLNFRCWWSILAPQKFGSDFHYLTLARACAAKGYCSRSVCRSVGQSGSLFPRFLSRTVAAVDAKRGYVGMCNGRSAQQESGAALSKNSIFTAGA